MTDEMWNGLLFYGILAVVTAIFADLSVRKKLGVLRGFFAFMTVFLPSLFVGLRYGIGTDYFNYLEIYNTINNSGKSKIDEEIIYWVINKIAATFGWDFNVVLFIVALITTLFIYLALRKYKNEINIGLGMFIYMMTFYQKSYNITRQMAAVAILLYAVEYIQKRKLWHFTLFNAIAMGFHSTALLFYPLYFLNWLYGSPKHKLLRIISFTGLIIIMVDFSTILFPLVNRFGFISYYAKSYLYSEREFELRIGMFLRILPFIIPGMILWNKVKQDKRMVLYFNILIIGCITLLTAYSSTNYTERIAHYFLSAQIIFVPFIFKQSVRARNYIGILVVLAIIALWWNDHIYMGRGGTIPYEWIFSDF